MKKYLLLLCILCTSAAAYAVTDKEMDKARAIAAKAYLRYANPGSGYLDEFSVSSMSELEGKIKDKEKENLKAFKAVSTPKDYASWDKEKLVQYWATTFFQSSGLDPEGVKGKVRVRKQVQEMEVSAPAAAAETPAEQPQEAAGTAPEIPDELTSLGASDATDVPEVAADSAINENLEEVEEQKPAKSHTWIYIVILAVLVAVVVWLVLFASKTMRRQNQDRAYPDSDDEAMAEPRDLAETSERQASELKTLRHENETLRLRVASLQAEITALHSQIDRIAAERDAARSQMPVAPLADIPANPAPQRPATTIYLGRINNRGVFVRADRNFTPGHSIFRLVTSDGVSGSFYVSDKPEAVDLALLNPAKTIINGCAGEDLENSDGVTDIENLSAGTAIFEDGVWRVTRKARIRYLF